MSHVTRYELAAIVIACMITAIIAYRFGIVVGP